jgi:hypothetical protein
MAKLKLKLTTEQIGFALVAAVVLIGVFALSIAFLPDRQSQASGVAVSLIPQTQNVSTTANITLAFPLSTSLNIGDTVTIGYPDSYTGSISAGNTTVNGVAPSLASTTNSGGVNTTTLTLANSIATPNTLTIVTTLTTPVSAGNYPFIIDTSVGDYGASLQYVGEANVVEVRAYIPITLSFDIRNAADTANTNICDLGSQSTSSVSSCQYRLKVTTNATGGYTINMTSDGDFDNGSYNLDNAASGSGGSGGTAITAGTEKYGVRITPGSLTSGNSIGLTSIFDAGATNFVNYAYTSPQAVVTALGTNSPAVSSDTTNTTLVTHSLAIDNNTAAGLYIQKITYTVTPSF